MQLWRADHGERKRSSRSVARGCGRAAMSLKRLLRRSCPDARTLLSSLAPSLNVVASNAEPDRKGAESCERSLVGEHVVVGL